jgi:hypothetical protein
MLEQSEIANLLVYIVVLMAQEDLSTSSKRKPLRVL